MDCNLIYILLLNYNGYKDTIECIKSLEKITYKNYKIVILDNASTDNSEKILKEKFPQHIFIQTGSNLGFAGGNNVGIKYALKNGADYVLLLNNDTIVDKHFLSYLVKNADEKTITVPKMYYYKPNNMIWYAGGKIDWNKGIVVHFGMNKFDNQKFNKKKYVDFGTGCCLFIHKNIFKDVGLLDEKYFMYYEDADFSVRVLDKNYKILYVPKALLWHKVSSSTGGENSKISVYYGNRNRFYFLNKFRDKTNIYSYIYSYLTRVIKYSLALLKNNNDKYILTAYKDYRNNKMYFKDFNK